MPSEAFAATTPPKLFPTARRPCWRAQRSRSTGRGRAAGDSPHHFHLIAATTTKYFTTRQRHARHQARTTRQRHARHQALHHARHAMLGTKHAPRGNAMLGTKYFTTHATPCSAPSTSPRTPRHARHQARTTRQRHARHQALHHARHAMLGTTTTTQRHPTPRHDHAATHATPRHAVASDAVLTPFALRVPEKGTLRRQKWPAGLPPSAFRALLSLHTEEDLP